VIVGSPTNTRKCEPVDECQEFCSGELRDSRFKKKKKGPSYLRKATQTVHESETQERRIKKTKDRSASRDKREVPEGGEVLTKDGRNSRNREKVGGAVGRKDTS